MAQVISDPNTHTSPSLPIDLLDFLNSPSPLDSPLDLLFATPIPPTYTTTTNVPPSSLPLTSLNPSLHQSSHPTHPSFGLWIIYALLSLPLPPSRFTPSLTMFPSTNVTLFIKAPLYLSMPPKNLPPIKKLLLIRIGLQPWMLSLLLLRQIIFRMWSLYPLVNVLLDTNGFTRSSIVLIAPLNTTKLGSLLRFQLA